MPFPYSPRYHWKADTLGLANGANVASWPDSSGNGHNLAPPGTAPTYVAPGLNGMGVVRFNGSTQQLDTADSPAAAAYEMIAVVIPRGLPSVRPAAIGIQQTGGGWANSIRITLTPKWESYWYDGGIISCPSTTAPVVGTGVIVGASAQGGGTAQVWINGTSENSVAVGSLWTGGTAFSLGNIQNSDPNPQWAQVDIAEFLLWTSVLAAADRTDVVNTLNTKWFVAPPATAIRPAMQQYARRRNG